MSSWGAARRYQVAGTSGNECVIEGDKLQCHIETRSLDLNVLDELDIFAGRQLVTASALLDLVSETWLRRACRALSRSRRRGPVRPHLQRLVFVLAGGAGGRDDSPSPQPASENRTKDWAARPRDPMPRAAPPAVSPMPAIACGVSQAIGSSEPAELELQRELVDGWARAATELVPDEASGIAQWRARRIAHIEAGRSHIVVGHVDVAAII